MVVVTGLFGAIVVKLNLAHLSISVHLLFAIALLQIQLALLLSTQNKLSQLLVERKTKNLILFFLIIILLQSVLGTMVRMDIDDISKLLQYKMRETWLQTSTASFYIHRTFSWFVLVTSLFVAWKCRKIHSIKNKVNLAVAIILLSMVTGIVLFYMDMPAFIQPIHLLLATLVITQTFSICFQTKSIAKNSN